MSNDVSAETSVPQQRQTSVTRQRPTSAQKRSTGNVKLDLVMPLRRVRVTTTLSRSSSREKAMGWTPPHTYGIECQTGDVKQPVTE